LQKYDFKKLYKHEKSPEMRIIPIKEINGQN
jgi:hypothetical protein